MGYSASSYVIFGKKTSVKALTINTKVRGCNHKIDEGQKFCSECGKPVWVQKETFIADEELDLKVRFFAPTYENDDGVLGFRINNPRDNDIEELSSPSPEMVQDILNFYKENGIACREKDLKTYVFTYHSY